MAKVVKVKMTPVQRAIASRERGLSRMENNIRRVQVAAEEEIALIRKRMASVRVLLEALKRGDLKP